MTIVCWTLDGTYSGEALRKSRAALMGYAPSGRPLGASSGVRGGTPTTTVSISGTGPYNAVVGPHAGVLDVETSTTAGAYDYANDANVTLALNAADATNPRIDLVSVQLIDTNEGDTGTSGVTFVYTAGTAAAVPAAPATPNDAMVLAQITVPKSGGGAPSAAWVAPTFTVEPVAYSYGSQTTGQSIPNNSNFVVSGWGVGGQNKRFTYGLGIWTVQVAGWYDIDGQLGYTASATGARQAAVQINGAVVSLNWLTGQASTQTGTVPFTWSGPLNVGDQISIQAFQNSGASLALVTSVYSNRISIRRSFTV